MIYPAFIVFLTTIIESVGLTILRQGSTFSIPLASSIYAFGVVPLLKYSLNYKGIGLINFLWNVFSTIIMFIIGVYIFGEKIRNLQLLGVLISLLGISLVIID